MRADAASRADFVRKLVPQTEIDRFLQSIDGFQPINNRQREILKSTATGTVVLGGNRGGKTKIGGAETVYRLLGNHPYKQTHKPPIKAWCCSQDLPGVVKAKGDDEQEVHKQLEQLKMLIPPRALKGGSWATAFSPTEHRVDLVNKSVVLFKSYSQGPLAFESDAIHWCWHDEEPPDKTIWTSSLMRLIDFSGQWMMTATPLLSLEGKGWIEELWDNRMKPGCPYVVHQLFTRENTTLSKATIEASFANLSDEERQVREYGAFARVGGKVLSEFKPDVHLIDGFIPPADWRHYIIIDPGGRNATAALFAAVDPDGVIYLYAEYYEKDRLPGDHIISIDAIVRALNVPWETVETIIDSAAWNVERTLAQGKLDRSLLQEYQMQADLLDAKWFRPNKSNKADVFAWRVKRYFKSSKLFVMKHLHWWQWEAERWTYPKGTRSFEMNHGLPEKPVDKDNHLLDCLTGDTLIATERGEVPISEVRPGDLVHTRCGLRKVFAAWSIGEREVFEVRLSNGKSLVATSNHQVLVDGEWAQVFRLAWWVDDPVRGPVRLLAPSGDALTVLGVSRREHPEMVYDLQIEDVPEFYANGVLVHNCTRYLVNELPDPLEEDTKKPVENTPEWRAMKDIERATKQVFNRGRGPLGSEW